MNPYVMLIIATFLYSVQFIFNKVYQKTVGYTAAAGGSFLALSSLIFGLLIFGYNGFQIHYNGYTVLIVAVSMLLWVVYTAVNVVVLNICSMAQYTFYLMLGGMTLPFLYGLVVQGEALTWQKLCCFAVIVVSMYLESRETRDGNKRSKKTWIYLVGIFILNGVLSTALIWHEYPPAGITAGTYMDYTFWLQIFCLFGGLAMMGVQKLRGQGVKLPKDRRNQWKALGAGAGYALVHGVAGVLTLIALQEVDASVQYPIITGGCIVLGAFSGIAFGEKITGKKVICAIIALAGTFVLMIP